MKRCWTQVDNAEMQKWATSWIRYRRAAVTLLSLNFSPRSLSLCDPTVFASFCFLLFRLFSLPIPSTLKPPKRQNKDKNIKGTSKIGRNRHTQKRKKIINTDNLISFLIGKKNYETRCKRNPKQDRTDSTVISQTKPCNMWQVQHLQELCWFIYIHSHTHHGIGSVYKQN